MSTVNNLRPVDFSQIDHWEEEFCSENHFQMVWDEINQIVATHGPKSEMADSCAHLIERKVWTLIPPETYGKKLDNWKRNIKEAYADRIESYPEESREFLSAVRTNLFVLGKYFQAKKIAEESFFPDHPLHSFQAEEGPLELLINGNIKISYNLEEESSQPKIHIFQDDILREVIELPERYSPLEENLDPDNPALITIYKNGIEWEDKRLDFTLANDERSSIACKREGVERSYRNILFQNKKITIDPHTMSIKMEDIPKERTFLDRMRDLLDENYIAIGEYNERFSHLAIREKNPQNISVLLELSHFLFAPFVRKNLLREDVLFAWRYFYAGILHNNNTLYPIGKRKLGTLFLRIPGLVENFFTDEKSKNRGFGLIRTIAKKNREKLFDFFQLEVGNSTLWKEIVERGSPLATLLATGGKLQKEEMDTLFEEYPLFTFSELMKFSGYSAAAIVENIFTPIERFLFSAHLLYAPRWGGETSKPREKAASILSIIKASYAHSWSRLLSITCSICFGLVLSTILTALVLPIVSISFSLEIVVKLLDTLLRAIIAIPGYLFSLLQQMANLLIHSIGTREESAV